MSGILSTMAVQLFHLPQEQNHYLVLLSFTRHRNSPWFLYSMCIHLADIWGTSAICQTLYWLPGYMSGQCPQVAQFNGKPNKIICIYKAEKIVSTEQWKDTWERCLNCKKVEDWGDKGRVGYSPTKQKLINKNLEEEESAPQYSDRRHPETVY